MRRLEEALLAIQACMGEVVALAWVAAALAGAVLFGGCSAAGGPRIDDVSAVGSTTVVFVEPDEYDQDDRKDVLEAISSIQAAWSSDFSGAVLPSFMLQVLDVDEFFCGGAMAIGCTRRNGVVAVVRGHDDELPGLYHELCHRASASSLGLDPKHEDPRWPGWTRRGFELSESIAKRRSWW